MKVFSRLICLMVLSLCFVICTKVEAANALLLPVNVNVTQDNIQSIYYDRAVEALKQHPEIDLVTDSQSDKIVEKYKLDAKLPTNAELENIANEYGLDYIIAMSLDELNEKFVSRNDDDYLVLTMKGRAVGFNRFNEGKKQFINTKIYSDKTVPVAVVARSNFSLEQWGHAVSANTNKIIGNKKFNLYKQTIGYK